jgi:hypothetical protein
VGEEIKKRVQVVKEPRVKTKKIKRKNLEIKITVSMNIS